MRARARTHTQYMNILPVYVCGSCFVIVRKQMYLYYSCYFFFHRVAKDIEDKSSHYEPSIDSNLEETDTFKFDEHDFVPHFQRVSISGEDTSGVSKITCLLYMKCLCRACGCTQRMHNNFSYMV